MQYDPHALTVLYRDDHLIAIDKPSGLLTHRSAIARDVRVFALQLVRKLVGRRVYAPHRLDRGTSGVLVFALDRDIARDLAEQFAARTVHKTYHAIVRGHPDPRQGTIERPIDDSENAEPKEARTDYRVLATGALPIPVGRYPETWTALVELKPHTGRRHQLRRHCVHIRHPIIGDTTHGDGKNNRVFRAAFDAHRLLLYASRLTLTHPRTGAPLDLHAPPDPILTRICDRLGWPDPHAHAPPGSTPAPTPAPPSEPTP